MKNRPKPQPTTRRARMKRRRLGQVRRAKAAYRARRRVELRLQEQQRRQRLNLRAPLWRRPPEPPQEPYVPMQKEPGEILTNYTKPKRLTTRQRQRQMLTRIKSALERDRQWVETNLNNPYPDCRLKAAGICEGGLGQRERGLVCPRCVEDLGSGSVDGLVRDAIIRHVLGKQLPQRQSPRGPQRGGESGRSWRSSGERSRRHLPVDVGEFLREEF